MGPYLMSDVERLPSRGAFRGSRLPRVDDCGLPQRDGGPGHGPKQSPGDGSGAGPASMLDLLAGGGKASSSNSPLFESVNASRNCAGRTGRWQVASMYGENGAFRYDRLRARQTVDVATHHRKPQELSAPLCAAFFAAGCILASEPAAAQAQFSPLCGVTGSATAPASITYDPFAPGGLSQATIPLILQRTRNAFFGRTDEVSLVIVAPAGAPPLTITYQGQSVLYREGSTAGRPRALTSRDNGAGSAGEIRYDFGGAYASDLSSPFNLRVSIPPGSDLIADEPIYLDVLYICSGEGGMQSATSPVRESRAIRLDVNTVSALQAYY